ncbi:ceramide synthase [Chondrus crispus]|uniref:Ceramide synthase n=1 Tax=Chondrus crispus TaxID=2769 RepID=R7QFB8_CHOCR|nr:ceramide synthase [Chondrus crispus]CDF37222.1 ceramide synthase [Chondrus crispus]|eukprot:XP_005717041.1 ceramide synthase [Chondrus crispus]
METATGGLLRFPRFLRAFLASIRSQQSLRAASPPNLLYPEIRLSDAWLALLLAALLLSLRIALERFVFPRLFPQFPARKRGKLSENLFYAAYYTATFAYFAAAVLPHAEWTAPLLDNRPIVVRGLIHPFPPPMSEREHWYYAQSMGFYMSAAAFLLLFDGRRSDFAELILHHTVTIGLVGMSYAYGYVRAGMVIMALHDVGDIFLYSAKAIHYLGFAGFDTAVFAVFTVVFYVTRLVMFSRMVHTILVETLQVVVEEPAFNRWAMFYDTYLPHYAFFVVCLSTLLFLHCFWMALILRMIHRELFLGNKISDQGDIRSDHGSEDGGDDRNHDALFEDAPGHEGDVGAVLGKKRM